MSEHSPFDGLIRRVRAGDETAAVELVRTYEPIARRFVRTRLGAGRLRRAFDSMDVCQEALGSIFVRAALGQYDLDTPPDLLNLLETVARNELAVKAPRPQPEQADSPDGPPRRLGEAALPAAGPSPSEEVALRELSEKARADLSEDERRLAELRALGRSWRGIAVERGDTPEALRMRLGRAADRVARRFRLEEPSDG